MALMRVHQSTWSNCVEIQSPTIPRFSQGCLATGDFPMYHAGIVIYRMQLGILKEGREVDHIEEMIRLLKNTLAYRL